MIKQIKQVLERFSLYANSTRFLMHHTSSIALLVLPLAFFLFGCRTEPLTQLPSPDPNDEGTTTSIKLDFERGGKELKLIADDQYLYIESDGLAEHRMLDGIEAANHLVPLPQQYRGENSWKIPIKPRKSLKPVYIADSFYRGVIAIAVNGVPIVSSLNEELVHSFKPNELDDFGGHCGCGRGDEYHYHLAPIHLESIVGKGNPIAYALDGYPIFGLCDRDGNEPTDLDKYHGRMEEGGYRYYSSREFPYVNAGLRGIVDIRKGQVFPQPTGWTIRLDDPVANVSSGGCSYNASKKSYEIQYLGGNISKIEYSLKDPDTAEIKMTDHRFQTTSQLLSRWSANNDTPPPRKEEPKLPTTTIRVPDGFSGTVFFIQDASAPALKPQFGRLRIDIPKDGVVRVPDLKPIGDHYSIYAEFVDGTAIRSETRKNAGGTWVNAEWVPAKQYAELTDGGGGSKENAKGKMVTWLGFHIGTSENRGVLPSFPPGL